MALQQEAAYWLRHSQHALSSSVLGLLASNVWRTASPGTHSCSVQQTSSTLGPDQPCPHPSHSHDPAASTSSCSANCSMQRSRSRAWHDGPTATLAGPLHTLQHSRGFARAATERVAEPPESDAGSSTLDSDLLQHIGRNLLTPQAIVAALDKYITGQADAKRAVAVALRNRWRRSQLPKSAADEVMPKNILMVGPTGCGKTEIARRLAKLADAPFVKVEATKFTETGYVGKDVESMIEDLLMASQTLVQQRIKDRAAAVTAERAERIIVTALVGEHAPAEVYNAMLEYYRKGELDERKVTVELSTQESGGNNQRFNFEHGLITMELHVPPSSMRSGTRKTNDKKTLTVKEARQRIQEAESATLLKSDQVKKEALRATEQDGIVFIDEIDKIVEPPGGKNWIGNVNTTSVQQDLLPIIEGSIVNTKLGNVNTEHILFICAGAFHSARPQDMMPELQGRLPIRVSLKGLTADDFYRILTEPHNNMVLQQQALMATEGVALTFTEGALRSISKAAEEANRLLDNIGARRLHTVLERVLTDISYSGPDKVKEARQRGLKEYQYEVTEELVAEVMGKLLKKKDLSRYVL